MIDLDYGILPRERRLSRLAMASVILALLCNPCISWIVTRRVLIFHLIRSEENRTLTRVLLLPVICFVVSMVAMVRVLRSQERLRGEYVAAAGGSICITWILGVALFFLLSPKGP